MKIKWLGHSAFYMEESTGTVVVADPYAGEVIGYDMPKTEADVVTMSHQHGDHNYIAGVEGFPIIIDKAGAYEIKGVHISSIKSFHDSARGNQRGENLIFKYRIDGVEICHLGDIGEPCSVELSELIGSVDILLIPVGGNYTIDAKKAFDYVEKLMPDVVIPMHYYVDGCSVDIDDEDDFVDMFEDEQVEYIEGDTLIFDRADFEHESTKIYVMKFGN